MNNNNIAWAAGLFDGEGTFQIAKQGGKEPKYFARMRLGMCHQGAVQKFTDIMGVGGNVPENTPGPKANYVQYRWSTSGANAIKCAKALRPYLVVKGHEADILLQWESLIADGRQVFLTPENVAERERLYQEMLAARSTFLKKIERV